MASVDGTRTPGSPQIMWADIDFGILATSETITVGHLPAGAFYTGIQVTGITIFNSGTSDKLEIGTGAYGATAADVDSIEDDVDVQATGVIALTYVIEPLTIISADYSVPISVTYTAVGVQSTTGKARVAITFVQP